MIKIQIENIQDLKTEYLVLVKPLVIADLTFLQLSIAHLITPGTISEDDILDVKTLTKDIVNIIRTPNVDKGYFNKRVYKNGAANYQIGATAILATNWQDLLNLINHLLDWDNGSLQSLLTGDPSSVKQINDNLLLANNITQEHERDILKFGFKYKDGNVGKQVRSFFYGKSLTTFCPYCNQGLALHTENIITGKTADQFHLDHFFDKDNNPLLALSLFNLVPSDATCNVTNKHITPFSDKFHLNPYISGFKRDMVFEPVLTGESVTELKLKINVARNSARHLQLMGDANALNEAPEHGNLNIFQLYTKYNQPHVYEKSTWVLGSFLRAARNVRSLKDFLEAMGEENTDEGFIKWYERAALTHFYEKEFGKHGNSKLNRDLLDYVFTTYDRPENQTILQKLQNSYHPDIGGE
jgi:hypothetical protein